MGHVTTIKLKKELAKIGAKEETYEDIIKWLLQFYRKNAKHF